jgi:hypothetical protein
VALMDGELHGRTMQAVSGVRPTLPLLAMMAPWVATPALASCGDGEDGVGSPLPYVAEFPLGADTPEAREFVLTPTPGPRVQVRPEPSPAPPMTPAPDLGEAVPFEPSTTPAPDAGGQSPLELAFQPSVAWVDDGQYLGVVTYGSSSCPSGPLGIEVVADQEIEIRLGPVFSDRDVCSADMSGHATVLALPEGISPTKPLMARFAEREVRIPAVGR